MNKKRTFKNNNRVNKELNTSLSNNDIIDKLDSLSHVINLKYNNKDSFDLEDKISYRNSLQEELILLNSEIQEKNISTKLHNKLGGSKSNSFKKKYNLTIDRDINKNIALLSQYIKKNHQYYNKLLETFNKPEKMHNINKSLDREILSLQNEIFKKNKSLNYNTY